jgi:hypothetical protein
MILSKGLGILMTRNYAIQGEQGYQNLQETNILSNDYFHQIIKNFQFLQKSI